MLKSKKLYNIARRSLYTYVSISMLFNPIFVWSAKQVTFSQHRQPINRKANMTTFEEY